MRNRIKSPEQTLVEKNLTNSLLTERQGGRIATLAMGALFMLAPVLMGAEGCDVADLGGNGGSGGGGGGENICGGLAGAQCDADEFCNFPADVSCGAADQTGTCEERPEVCGEIYAPVCGCDDKTYSNECDAHRAGVSVVQAGECDSGPIGPEPGLGDCGGLAGLSCDRGEFCNFPLQAACGAADQLGTCEVMPEVCDTSYNPVCGCDDKTYSNECVAHSAGVSVVQEGECGTEPGNGDCGGIAGLTCARGEFCNFPTETNCGSGDQMGTCETPPDACTFIFQPVCGCDGKTYGNECDARGQGVSIASEGACEDEDPPKTCGGNSPVGSLCDEGQFCSFSLEDRCGAADQPGVCVTAPEACTQQYDPVCGCDGKTYGIACTAASAGTSVASTGECPTE